MSNGLTTSQNRRLKALESQISRGAQNIYQGLRAIHEEKLYLGSHDSFEAYCHDRWGMSRPRAYQLLKHGQVLRLVEEDPEMSTIVDTVRESHTREVADLPPEEAAEIITETIARTDGKPTARAVRETRYGDEDDPFAVDETGPIGPTDEELPPPPSTDSGEHGGNGAGDSPTGENAPKRPSSVGVSWNSLSKKTPDELFRIQKAKAVKTAEALSREIGDLNEIRAIPRCDGLLQDTYSLIEELGKLRW